MVKSGSPAAHGRHDTNLGFAFDRDLQNLIAANDLAVDEYVDVRPHFTSFGQHSIAQADVRLPKSIQSFADGRGIAIDFDLGAAIRKFSQVTGDLKSDHMEPDESGLQFASILLAVRFRNQPNRRLQFILFPQKLVCLSCPLRTEIKAKRTRN